MTEKEYERQVFKIAKKVFNDVVRELRDRGYSDDEIDGDMIIENAQELALNEASDHRFVDLEPIEVLARTDNLNHAVDLADQPKLTYNNVYKVFRDLAMWSMFGDVMDQVDLLAYEKH